MSNIKDFVIEKGKLIEYIGDEENIVVPYGVKIIGEKAFKDCEDATKIELPESVIRIENEAFANCFFLESITIHNGVNKIGEEAFTNCIRLTSITIPGSVKTIGKNAFCWCESLALLTLCEGVESIGEEAFYWCESLSSITIPKSVKNIGIRAFCDCVGLASVNLPDGEINIGSGAFKGCNCLSDNNGFVIVNGVLYDSFSEEKDIVIPNSVKRIGNSAFFSKHKLHSVTITGTVESIGESAFSDCDNLASVTFCEGIQNIESRVFDYCPRLRRIQLPEKTESFEGSVLEVTYKHFIKSQHITTFLCEFLKQYPAVSANVKKINTKMRANKQFIFNRAVAVDDVELVSDLFSLYKYIKLAELNAYFEETDSATGVRAFILNYKNEKYSAEMQEKYETDKLEKALGIKELTFREWGRIYDVEKTDRGLIITAYKGSDENVVIPERMGRNKVVAIGAGSFSAVTTKLYSPDSLENKKIRTIVVPYGVESIGDGAFSFCKALKTVTISRSVTTIGKDAFRGCDSLEQIIVDENNPEFSSVDGVLFDKYKSALLLYPSGKAQTGYSIPDGVLRIGDGAFLWHGKIKSVTLPKSLNEIGKEAFKYCEGLEEITINEGVTNICAEAFYGCCNIKEVTLPESLKEIGAEAFKYCELLEEIKIYDNVTTIGKEAFFLCVSLTKFVVLASDIKIGEMALFGCHDVCVYGRAKSYVQEYAAINRLKFYIW